MGTFELKNFNFSSSIASTENQGPSSMLKYLSIFSGNFNAFKNNLGWSIEKKSAIYTQKADACFFSS